jgi:membrane fusion protein (multidrug efflux system)
MAFSRRTLSIVTVVLIVSLLGAGVWWRLRPTTPGEGEAEAAEIGGDAAADLSNAVDAAFSTDVPQPVTGATVVRDTLWISVNAAGRADAVNRAVLQAQVSGVIGTVRVRENNEVARGATLLQIDTTEYALEVAAAASNLRRARADYQQRVLFDDRIQDPAVQRQRDMNARAQSGLDQAEVTLRQATLRLERARVRAPFEGRIADVRVVPGQHVTQGTDLMTVVDLDPIKVEVNVLEAELGLLIEGARSIVRFTGFPGETFEGRIETVNPVVDPEKRTGRVTVLLANPGGRIKPGMYAEVSLAATSFPDRLLVPREAILERGEGTRRTMLFVYEQDGAVARARWRYVLVGHMNDRLAEIIPSEEGTVEPGEIVLVNGHHYLSHDTVVRLVDNVAVEGGRPGG